MPSSKRRGAVGRPVTLYGSSRDGLTLGWQHAPCDDSAREDRSASGGGTYGDAELRSSRTDEGVAAAIAAPAGERGRGMRNWRYVVGTFQVMIRVTTGDVMLRPDEDALAVMT